MPQCKSERKQDLGQSLLASEYGIHWRKKRKMVLVSRDKASGLPALLTEATSWSSAVSSRRWPLPMPKSVVYVTLCLVNLRFILLWVTVLLCNNFKRLVILNCLWHDTKICHFLSPALPSSPEVNVFTMAYLLCYLKAYFLNRGHELLSFVLIQVQLLSRYFLLWQILTTSLLFVKSTRRVSLWCWSKSCSVWSCVSPVHCFIWRIDLILQLLWFVCFFFNHLEKPSYTPENSRNCLSTQFSLGSRRVDGWSAFIFFLDTSTLHQPCAAFPWACSDALFFSGVSHFHYSPRLSSFLSLLLESLSFGSLVIST